MVWGFSPGLWQQLDPSTLPDNVHPFTGVEGRAGVNAPATQSDLWVWVQGNPWEKVWHTATTVQEALTPPLTLDYALDAFVGADIRDPTGFIDGTANPAIDEAIRVSVVPEGQKGAGGVPVLVQKWIHNLKKFNAISVPEQQDVFGRTKVDSVQLDHAHMPATSHVSRTSIHGSDGSGRHIYRRNTPFAATPGEAGSQFIGCAADVSAIDEMLDRMFGRAPDGIIDHFTLYSTPVTGSYYWTPPMEDLDRIFGPIKAPRHH